MGGAESLTVSRTYRQAIKVGDEYITLESVITLPLGADADVLAEALRLDREIFLAQRDAITVEAELMRGGAAPAPAASGGHAIKEPDAPASEKQRNFIARLQDDLGWTGGQLGAFASERGVDLVGLTKGQASELIEQMKEHRDSRAAAPAAPPPARAQPNRARMLQSANGAGEPSLPEPNGDDGQGEIPF